MAEPAALEGVIIVSRRAVVAGIVAAAAAGAAGIVVETDPYLSVANRYGLVLLRSTTLCCVMGIDGDPRLAFSVTRGDLDMFERRVLAVVPAFRRALAQLDALPGRGYLPGEVT